MPENQPAAAVRQVPSQGPIAKSPPLKDQKPFDPGESIAMLLLRLPQLVKIHQPNNQIFVENIALFQQTLATLWAQSPTLSVRLHRGRLYINERRLSSSQALTVTINKLGEIFEAGNYFGFRFTKVEQLPDQDIIDFIKDFNQSQTQPEPGVWLNTCREGSWVTPILDKDFKIAIIITEEGSGKPRPVMWTSGVRTLAVKAKQSYSRALAALAGINEKLSGSGQSTSINKPKRVIQDMVESLFQNENLLLSLSTIRDYDDYTCTHSVNVAILSMCLGKRLGLNKVSVMTLGLSALFHDLGKIDIPIDLIRKTTKFTDDEYELVKNHTLFSVLRILKINAEHTLKSKLLVSPYEHHLGIDLTGYPHNGRHSPLTLFGRIVAITDHYDALTSSRSYRPVPISPEQALDIMLRIAGTELDPLLLKVFINMIGIYPIGTLLLLDSHEVAIVSETPPSAEEARPMCYLLDFENNEITRGDYINLAAKNDHGLFQRNILRCFHPTEFGLNPTEILL
ncbi:MAG: HD domain-containing protein [Deltaproteobacteria bacterium]|jgi:HD-GYP domain-containing protein (c-di-GMP phosphodiesterase class II)|nr:HD domain-containing protein [Deltaproteobacteria bacterium]